MAYAVIVHAHRRFLAAVMLCAAALLCAAAALPPRSPQYARLQRRLAQGWNTWSTYSVTTQVLLPSGFALQTGIERRSTEYGNADLSSALIGRLSANAERVFPGPHAYDGSYTDLTLAWRGLRLRIQSAHAGGDLVMLVTPLARDPRLHLPPEVVFSAHMLWQRPGQIEKRGETIVARLPGGGVRVFLAGRDRRDLDLPAAGAWFSAVLDRPVGLSTGRPRTLAAIRRILRRQLRAYRASVAGYGRLAPVADAIQTVLGWDTIYDPGRRRVISPVSRIWSVNWGGYVLFDWDTFFAARLAAVGDRDLAYANAEAICRELTPAGFVPNYARAQGWKSNDRSEPPVGAMTLLALYRRFHDRWLLRDTYPLLLRWNRWWARHRQRDGYLVWGSDGENRPRNLDDSTAGTRAGAILESGLDNSPMYDTAVYDARHHQLEFADVGLMSLYIADCRALAQIADLLGHPADAAGLRAGAARFRARLATLWQPRAGIFLNKDLHTGQFSQRLSPTNFYPLLAGAATPAQAERMVSEHLLNPREFWGRWVLPSIARDDPAFRDQNYWRGRIWGPMNYLVWLGLGRYSSPLIARARRRLAQKSLALFLKDWLARGHVHENYNAITGAGDDVGNSDRFYTWGALLGLISLEDARPGAAP